MLAFNVPLALGKLGWIWRLIPLKFRGFLVHTIIQTPPKGATLALIGRKAGASKRNRGARPKRGGLAKTCEHVIFKIHIAAGMTFGYKRNPAPDRRDVSMLRSTASSSRRAFADASLGNYQVVVLALDATRIVQRNWWKNVGWGMAALMSVNERLQSVRLRYSRF